MHALLNLSRDGHRQHLALFFAKFPKQTIKDELTYENTHALNYAYARSPTKR
jgi:hypothetical protein